MQPVPPEVWADFERRLDGMRVPPPQRPDYRKWVRFYFDFCHKYGHSTGAPASRGPFLAKLASKNQSVAQRSQASAAVGLLLEPASEPGATRLRPRQPPLAARKGVIKGSVNEIVMFLPNPLVPPAWAEGKRDDLQCSI